jgi:uncharacterized protein involved in exopolysaccharide biosynthesis
VIVEQEQNNNILLELVRCLWKHLLGMLILFTTIMVVVIVSTQLQTPIYEVASRVMVQFGREYIYRSVEGRTAGDVSPLVRYDPQEVINTEIEIFRSKELVEDVLNTIGIEKIFPKMAQNAEDMDFLLTRAVNSFLDMLKVDHIKGSTVFMVTFQHQNPDIAVLAVTNMIERFKKRHLEIYKNPNIEFLEKQVADLAKVLEVAEEEKSKYQNDNKIVTSLDMQRRIALEHYSTMNKMLVEEEGNLQKLKKEYEYIKESTINNKEQVLLSKQVEQRGNIELIELKLLELKRYRRSLTDKYLEDNRLVIAINDEIELTNDLLKTVENNKVITTRTGKSEHFFIMKRELADAEGSYQGQLGKVESIRQQVTLLKADLQTLAKREMDIKRIDDKIKTAGRDYEVFRNKLVESRAQDVLDREERVSVIVIDKARVPLKPIKPRKRIRILVGLILAMASCFFYALFREYILVREK